MAQLEYREQNITRTRLVAARFCLAVAAQSGHEALFKDVLNQFEWTENGDSLETRKSRMRDYGFWLDGTQPLRLPDGVLPAPQAVAITVQTDRFPRGDDDGFTLALHTQLGEPAMNVQLQMFNEVPQWWLDFGQTGQHIGRQFKAHSNAEGMRQHLAALPESATALEITSQAILASLSTAVWHETLNVRGDLF